jgi:hypothetical protein
MARPVKQDRVPVWVQPADKESVQRFADFCETATGTHDQPASRVVQTSPPPAQELLGNSFIQHGTCWNITYGPENAHLFDSVGLRSLAHLLSAPQEPVSVIELSMREHDTETTLAPYLMSQSFEVVDQQTLSSVLDETKRLEAELQDARELGDETREEAARSRLEDLVDSMQPSRGKRGRSRFFVGAAERTRQSVHKNVRRAFGAIGRQAPSLAAHLGQSVSISHYCVYAPAQQTNWTVQISAPTRAL